MLREKNECIDCKAFASLILDYEWPESFGLPAAVSCRVLIEDVFQRRFQAPTREDAIKIFRSGAWRTV